MNSFTITYQDTLPDALQINRDRFEEEARWAMAVKLFELGRLSSGLAASLIPYESGYYLISSGSTPSSRSLAISF